MALTLAFPTRRAVHALAVFAALAVISACAQGTNRDLKITSIAISGRGQDEGGDFCKDFDLGAADVISFFQRAHPVTARELHDNFEFLPCYVLGSAVMDGQTVSWGIRAGGTASVTKQGEELFYACDNCEDLLK